MVEMKILWLTLDFNRPDIQPYRHYYSTLETSIAEIADVTFHGRNEAESDVEKLVRETEPDVVMVYCDRRRWRNLDKVQIPKAYRCSDPWSNTVEKADWVNQNKIDLTFHLLGAAAPVFRKHVETECVPMFESVCHKLFTNLNLDRTYNVFATGNMKAEPYPLRNAIYHTYKRNQKCWVRQGPFSLPTLDDYITTLNKSKVFPTGCCRLSVFGEKDLRFFMNKSLEAMATETLLMMDLPTCAEELHLIPGHNFVEINRRNFRKQISYYLKNDEERKQIAQRGYETFIKHHTSDVRAGQILAHLKGLI